jgi:hypothetical protein
MKPHMTLRSLLLISCLATASPWLAADPAPEKPAGDKSAAPSQEPAKELADAINKLQLPGVKINLEQRCVDVDATICLDEGALEFIACTKGTKEHESVIAVEARPMHIHTALLLLGAKNGNPAMRRPLDKEMTRWQDIPPSGDPIDVFLVWKNEKSETVERPISDFIKRNDESETPVDEDKAKEKFPHTFLFAGSQLGDASETPRKYYADLSGHVISISAFGDELLCLPELYSQENGALAWKIESTYLPKLHSKVILRLRVKKTQP